MVSGGRIINTMPLYYVYITVYDMNAKSTMSRVETIVALRNVKAFYCLA